ncbi:hypothetical protein B7R22_09225 [Subtercola boreus]|uniref:Uncharacterized protein n=1 Tax=Subtercola boreus TaxID=120213 RepID=A0A3E0VXH2_9MICO|nr:hypothetical protein [Subtercola boreus]RFA14410.1 hypothetical protein B7R22_09225 [Subtercola boreus]
MLDLDDAPVPSGTTADLWRSYVTAYRADTPARKTLCRIFTDALVADPTALARFGIWALSCLFDTDDDASLPLGQWGGGLVDSHSLHATKPTVFALLGYPLTGLVLMPVLLDLFHSQPERYARWLFLFVSGPGYRLPPAESAILRATAEPYKGDYGYRSLLELGRDVDPRARRMLQLRYTQSRGRR